MLALIIGILCACPFVSAEDSLEIELKSGAVLPMIQSLAVPGLGQIWQGEWLRGGAYFAGEVFLAADAYYHWENQYDRPAGDEAGRLFYRDVGYSLALWYGMGAIFCGADAYYFSSKKRVNSPTMAALMSVVFPGWGQLANGQHWKGAGVFILQTSLAFSAYYQHQNYLYYDRRGQDSEAQFYRNDRNRLLWWSAGAVIVGAVDAFVDCHLRNWDVSDELSVAPAYFPEAEALGIGLRMQLN